MATMIQKHKQNDQLSKPFIRFSKTPVIHKTVMRNWDKKSSSNLSISFLLCIFCKVLSNPLFECSCKELQLNVRVCGRNPYM